MRNFKYELAAIISKYKGIRHRHVADPKGDSGGFLKMIFDDKGKSYQFRDELLAQGIKVRKDGFYPVHMTDWGLHIYYHIPALVKKKSICGHHSVWELQENAFAKNYTYDKGTLPVLDDFVERTVLFCIASKMTDEQKEWVKHVFVKTCDSILS